MTIGSTIPARVSFNCDGVTTVFPIPIQAYQNTDITVMLTLPASLGGTELVLTLNSDYSLASSGTLQPPQWTLTTLAAAAYAAGYTLQAFINPVQSQQTSYAQGQAFPSLAVQTNFDRLTQMVQRLQDQANRAIHAPDGDVSPGMLLPPATVRALMYLAFDANGNVLPIAALPGTLNTITSLGPILNPKTNAENNAGVVPVNYAYPAGNVLRYGADANGILDSAPAFVNAWKANGTIQIPAGTYAIKTQAVFNGANIEIFGAGISMTTLVFSAAGQFIFGDATNTTRNFYLQLEKLTINGNNRGQATDAIKMYSFSEFHFFHVYFIEIQGFAIYGEICQDGSVIDCQFIYCGDNAALGGGHANKAPLHLPYISVNENNHWDIIGNHFEANYFSDIYCQGKNVECDHFITKNKFGVPSYVIASDADVNQYHIQCSSVTALSIVDNWFINGGMAYLANSTVYHVMCNHGRNMGQGIWDDGGGGAAANISGNQIFGNNSATAVTGSLHANHWGVRIGGINSEVGPGNDISGFNVDYQVWAGATNIALILPVSGGAPATSAAGTLVDAGTATRLQQLDQPSVALPLLNSWAIGAFAPPGYSRSGNQVVLKGVVHGGTITGGAAIGTLPVGFRPTDSTRFFACYTDNGTTSAAGFLQVSTAGSVLIGTVPAGTVNISLDGIEFSVI